MLLARTKPIRPTMHPLYSTSLLKITLPCSLLSPDPKPLTKSKDNESHLLNPILHILVLSPFHTLLALFMAAVIAHIWRCEDHDMFVAEMAGEVLYELGFCFRGGLFDFRIGVLLFLCHCEG